MRPALPLCLLPILIACRPAFADMPVDGMIDTNFGTMGLARIDPAASGFGDSRRIQDVAIATSSSKFYLLGGAGSPLVTRMLADGALDTGFNGDGYATELTSPPLAGHQMLRIAVAADGKPIMVGEVTEAEGDGLDGNVAICRMFVAGNPDTGFDGDGCRVIEIDAYESDSSDYATALWPLPDKSLLVTGVAQTSLHGRRPFLAKLLENGSYDTDFGLGGLRYIDMPDTPTAISQQIVVDGAGAIYVAGFRASETEPSTFLAKFDAGGDPIQGFGNAGVAYTSFAHEYPANHQLRHHVTGLAVDDLGRIWQCGNIQDFSVTSQMIALARFDTDGVLDASFDGDGRVFIGFSELNAISKSGPCVLDRERRLTVSLETTAIPVYDPELAVMRFVEDGRTDEDFHGAGRLSLALNLGQGGSGSESVAGLLPQRDDLVVFATAQLDANQQGGPNEYAAIRLRNDRHFRDGFEAHD